MKKQLLILITGLLIIASSAFAQKKDHPLIGHLEGAELWMQNINKIHEYLVITGPMENDSLVSSVKVVGKVTMTSYEYKGDNSAFGIIHNYTDFLKNNGFEILLSCKGGKCGGNIAKYYNGINRIEPFDQNNAIAWQSRYFKNFLSAKKQINGKTVYVCIYIAQGWWKFPIYRIDVIEESEQTNMIINNNDNEVVSKDAVQQPSTNKNATNAMTSNANLTASMQASLFSFQVGMGSYNFYDPQLYGEEYVVAVGDVSTGTLSGFRDLSGPYFKAVYYLNENLGVVADVAFQDGSHQNYIESGTSSIDYETEGSLNYQRIGLAGRFVGDKYPIALTLSSGFGRGGFEAYYKILSMTDGIVTSEAHYEGDADFLIMYFQAELIIPVFKGLFVFSEYEYSVGWGDDLIMEHYDAVEYTVIKYNSPMFGGNNLRIGLGYEYGRK